MTAQADAQRKQPLPVAANGEPTGIPKLGAQDRERAMVAPEHGARVQAQQLTLKVTKALAPITEGSALSMLEPFLER